MQFNRYPDGPNFVSATPEPSRSPSLPMRASYGSLPAYGGDPRNGGLPWANNFQQQREEYERKLATQPSSWSVEAMKDAMLRMHADVAEDMKKRNKPIPLEVFHDLFLKGRIR